MISALRILTIVPGGLDHRPAGRTTLIFFPVVGLLIAAVWALPGEFIGARLTSGGVLAALVLLLDAIVTRGMHLDAIADVADGAASGRSDDEGLAIMRDPTIGAIGAATLLLVCLLRYGALINIAEFPHRLFAAPVTGRAAMVLLIAWLPALQDGSVGHRLAGSPRWALVAAGLLAVGAAALSGTRGVAALGLGLVVAVVYGLWFRARFSEMGRDGLGAGCLIAETTALVLLSSN